jgi:PAS domain S-box-containing protein
MGNRTTQRHSATVRRRPERAPELVVSDRSASKILETALEAVLIVEQETMCFRWANAAACALLGYTRTELLSMSVPDIHALGELRPILDDSQHTLARGVVSRAIPLIRKDGARRLVDVRTALLEIDGVACLVGFFNDVTEARHTEAHNRELARAVEQTTDSVIITGADGTIAYANPAFERLTGWSRDEAIGRNPRMLKSGRQSDAFYRAFWRRLVRGSVWRGSLVNRRKDGALYEVQATISPLHGPDGDITGYVGVERDVTAIRAAETALLSEFRERSRAAAALGRLQPAATAEATAADICDELLALPGFDVVTVFNFAGPAVAIPLAHGGAEGSPLTTGQPIPEARARYLYDRASLGPWAEAWHVRRQDAGYGAAMAAAGIKAAAYAPIRNGDGLLGLIAAGTTDAEFAQHLIDHLPMVGEFAATASALLSRWLETEHRAEVARRRIEQVIAAEAFQIVFQPIFDLVSDVPVGYEALTRFEDGTAPDRLFAEAHAVDLGVTLEMACVANAVDQAQSLESDAWVSVNVSPAVLQTASELGSVLRRTPRQVVLELTEHAAVADYAELRKTVERLGPMVRLAVDDAGSGFASMRHVVELRPQFLKVDISLVTGVSHDVTRQAMIAGLVRFAEQAQCAVIAEGIEERSDLRMLRQLGVQYGQGFLLGRPRRFGTAPRG